MADVSPLVKSDGEEIEASSSDDDSSSPESSGKNKKLTKMNLPQHIGAYLKNLDMNREITPIVCDKNVVEQVMINYIIVKNILSNLKWQDKMVCKHVCTTWRSAINSLQKEQIAPVDFIISFSPDDALFEKSSEFYNEPLAVFAFANVRGFNATSACKNFKDIVSCTPPCDNEHFLIDILQQHITMPKQCMLTGTSMFLNYMPLATSPTAPDTITRDELTITRSIPKIMAIYIPVIPDVKFDVLNIVTENSLQASKEFYTKIDKLAETRIIKGLIVYVTEKFLLQSVEDIIFLDYVKKVQPDIPYALAGCVVEETMFQNDTIMEMINARHCIDMRFASDNYISIGIFTVSKDQSNVEKNNFDMYSLVVESSEWSKEKIKTATSEFSKSVPRFEHSVALKLSCVGRDQKHDLEQDVFREAFPSTPIAGCYGNGELGVNHPVRVAPEKKFGSAKRHKTQKALMYSYSTVFMYIGWGKILSDGSSKS